MYDVRYVDVEDILKNKNEAKFTIVNTDIVYILKKDKLYPVYKPTLRSLVRLNNAHNKFEEYDDLRKDGFTILEYIEEAIGSINMMKYKVAPGINLFQHKQILKDKESLCTHQKKIKLKI